jgi:hypothetical protein
MSGHGRPRLCKPEPVSRARELCARGTINPDLLEPASWARQQNDRRKGRKGRKPRILRKWGPFPTMARSGGNPAETGGNPLQELCSRNRPQFCRLTQGVHSKP